MAKPNLNASVVAVKCFCGNSMSINPRARKAVTCNKCHQPLPMRAIRLAVEFRARASGDTPAPLKRLASITS